MQSTDHKVYTMALMKSAWKKRHHFIDASEANHCDQFMSSQCNVLVLYVYPFHLEFSLLITLNSYFWCTPSCMTNTNGFHIWASICGIQCEWVSPYEMYPCAQWSWYIVSVMNGRWFPLFRLSILHVTNYQIAPSILLNFIKRKMI